MDRRQFLGKLPTVAAIAAAPTLLTACNYKAEAAPFAPADLNILKRADVIEHLKNVSPFLRMAMENETSFSDGEWKPYSVFGGYLSTSNKDFPFDIHESLYYSNLRLLAWNFNKACILGTDKFAPLKQCDALAWPHFTALPQQEHEYFFYTGLNSKYGTFAVHDDQFNTITTRPTHFPMKPHFEIFIDEEDLRFDYLGQHPEKPIVTYLLEAIVWRRVG